MAYPPAVLVHLTGEVSRHKAHLEQLRRCCCSCALTLDTLDRDLRHHKGCIRPQLGLGMPVSPLGGAQRLYHGVHRS